jgi:uncharacterized MAPEG superfamily protein
MAPPMDKETVPYLCLLLAAMLIYVPRVVVLRAQTKQPGGLDNNLPRAQQAKLEGLGARANGAHQNSFEAFAPFAAGVLACKAAGVDADEIAFLSMAFVAIRAAYIGLYLSDRASARSLTWLAGLLCTLALLALPLAK